MKLLEEIKATWLEIWNTMDLLDMVFLVFMVAILLVAVFGDSSCKSSYSMHLELTSKPSVERTGP